MKNQVRECIRKALLKISSLTEEEIPPFTVEVPKEDSHGDFATNVAMLLAKPLRRAPRAIAAELEQELMVLAFIDKVEIAGPGFINLFVSPDAWGQVIEEVLRQGENYGRFSPAKPEKIMVEFVSANPTGPLHFGHGRGAVVGDVLANLLAFAGHEVSREFYVNDAGAQVLALARSVVYRLAEKAGVEAEFPEDGYQGEYVKTLAEAVPQDWQDFLPEPPDDEKLQKIQDFAIGKMLEDIRADLALFGVPIDRFASEREVIGSGRLEEAFAALDAQGLCENRDGAKWFLSDRFGDEKPRVLVKSTGYHTYFATDVAYHLDKIRRGYVRLINVWGADHHGYVPRMNAALRALGQPEGALEIVLVQMVSLLRDGKPVVMSKRKGEIVTLREVVEEVGSDAARFFFLLRGTDSQMDFDLELAKKRSMDNPVFYVQYGHARLSSILARAQERGLNVPGPESLGQIDLSTLNLPEQIRLIKKMQEFKEVVPRAAEARAPQQIVYYLQDLVSTFHHYYTAYGKTQPILGGEPDEIAPRLLLVQALREVLRVALGILGVSAPDRMESQTEDSPAEG